MPLTPEDVSNKRFTTVRLREGYDMTEVDQFLDEVEAELARLTGENTELRAKLHAAQNGQATGVAAAPAPADLDRAPAAAPPAQPDGSAAVEQPAIEESPTEAPAVEAPAAEAPAAEGRAAEAPAAEGRAAEAPAAPEAPQPEAPAPAAVAPAPVETLRVTTTAEASMAAARLLELAGRNADQLVGEAQQEAERLVAEARSSAEQLEAQARERAAALDEETTARRATVFGAIEEEKVRLDTEIENLRTFEREYRAELRTYFEEQLAALDGQGSGGVLGRSERGDSPRLEAVPDEPKHDESHEDQPHHDG